MALHWLAPCSIQQRRGGADTGGVRRIGICGNGAQRLNGQRGGLPGDVAHGLENAGSAAGVAGLAFGPSGLRNRHGGLRSGVEQGG